MQLELRTSYLLHLNGTAVAAGMDFKEAKRMGKRLAESDSGANLRIQIPDGIHKATGLPSLDALCRQTSWVYDRNTRKWRDPRDL
jgi:hypothetical protein